MLGLSIFVSRVTYLILSELKLTVAMLILSWLCFEFNLNAYCCYVWIVMECVNVLMWINLDCICTDCALCLSLLHDLCTWDDLALYVGKVYKAGMACSKMSLWTWRILKHSEAYKEDQGWWIPKSLLGFRIVSWLWSIVWPKSQQLTKSQL